MLELEIDEAVLPEELVDEWFEDSEEAGQEPEGSRPSKNSGTPGCRSSSKEMISSFLTL